MDDKTTPIEALFDKAEAYSKTTLELMKLQVIDKSAEAVSAFIEKSVILLAFVFFALMLSTGLALWLGELLGKNYYGFFAVAGVYAVLILLLFVFRQQWIQFPVSNAIISQMLKKKEHEKI